jgi:hypothetical protein
MEGFCCVKSERGLNIFDSTHRRNWNCIEKFGRTASEEETGCRYDDNIEVNLDIYIECDSIEGL